MKTKHITLVGNLVFMPHGMYSISLKTDPQINTVAKAINDGMDILVVTNLDEGEGTTTITNLAKIGTLCNIKSFINNGKDLAHVELLALERYEIKSYEVVDEILFAQTIPFVIKELDEREKDLQVKLINTIKKKLKEIAKYDLRLATVINVTVRNVSMDAEKFFYTLADQFLLKTTERLFVLEQPCIIKRLKFIHDAIDNHIEHVKIAHDISNQTKKTIDKTQKDYYLREQIKVINKELGDDDETEAREMLERLESCGAPGEVIEKLKKELKRLERSHPMSPETGMLRNYIETVLELPWKDESADEINLDKARKVLDAEHYNMEDVKDRIIEHMAVMQLNKNLPGQILCFVGPPGVGKTSIVESVARALGRNFVRISLGGVRDEAEIRGHRRTYVGAMPGKIINGMKKAKTINPVFLIDEIDKMAHDTHRGDPASAMLEVLDPVQNNAFTDHYLDVPYDLSHVLFICTANDEDLIPYALQDRMEIIRLSSYTLLEKIKIARRFLIPKIAKEHGITKTKIEVDDETLSFIIESYTREAGVRDLTRVIGGIFRKLAIQIINGSSKGEATFKLTTAKVSKMLGREKFSKDDLSKENRVGVVNGLSYTSTGGDIIKLEAVLTPGKGELKLTGRLGEVMKESAQIALSVTKSLARDYQIDPDLFEKRDIHIHFPSGAVPKEGPSAGVAIVCAMVSVFSGISVNGNYALTGEVTLSGRVLEVGGIREKVLSAYRYGIKNVILPSTNKKSLEKLPTEATKNMNFEFYNNVTDILKSVLVTKEK
ncbi:MAG: endopeptidase La [Firmicutes bacterium]|nr:endopeptidase La [Bacillota bacterium]